MYREPFRVSIFAIQRPRKAVGPQESDQPAVSSTETYKMAESGSMDVKAFSKLIEPVLARMEAFEQRLERIEDALARLALPFTNPSRPIPNNLGGPSFSKAPVSSVPQKRPLDREFSEADTVSRGSYRYQPLDTSRNEIRILNLTPSPRHTDPIRGNLLHVSLDDAIGLGGPSLFQTESLFGRGRSSQRYKALSYTWGEPINPDGPSSSILIAGASLRVTDNLNLALRQLRNKMKPTEASYWWIDAICINQDDVDERNSQVALMRRIYGSAMQVQVWLGDEYDGSTDAISLAKKLAHPPKRGPAYPRTVYADIPDETKVKNLACISSLLQRPWWDRVWVRQEVALGYNLSFLCGNVSCTLEELTAAERALDDSLLQLRVDLGQEEVAQILKIIQTKQAGTAEGLLKLRDKSRKGDDYVDLGTLLFHARDCRATDLRDKVFGVLGLADPNIYQLAVDYRLPIRDVFLKAAAAIISKTDRLDILSAAQNIDRVHSLPSWVPNLEDPWKAQPFPIDKSLFINRHELASKPAIWQINASGKVLTVKGRIYGYIQRLSDQVAKSTHSNHELHQVFCTWKEFAGSTRQANPEAKLFGGIMTIGIDLGNFGSSPEESIIAQLILVKSQQYPAISGFGFGNDLIQMDVMYSRSFLAPDAWIERRISNPLIQGAMRRYGVGRRVGDCGGGKIGLFPQDAREGDIIVRLYGAESTYVLRKQKGGCLLVGDASRSSSIVSLS